MSLSDPNRIKSLNARLLAARYAYYVEAQPIMTDQEFDALEKELRDVVAAADPKFAALATCLTAVGSDLVSNLGVVKHRQPMLSLDNAYTMDDVDKWAEGLPEDVTFTLEPKMDGLSLSARYTDHKLVIGLTRGDGSMGEDVTAAAMTIKDLPKVLPDSLPGDLELRGEVFMTTHQFERINEEAALAGEKLYANPRNLAAGTLKTKDVLKVKARGLSFLLWQVIGLEAGAPGVTTDPSKGMEHTAAIDYLHRMCPVLRQPQGNRCWSKAHLREAIELARKLREGLWKDLGYTTDGVVIKVEEHRHRVALGLGTKSPKWAIAYKFPAERGVTKLLGVTWQVGRTGKLTPVAELEPVLVSGSTISRTNLSNLTYIRKQLGDPHIGDVVRIYKGGEVIPQLQSIDDKHPAGSVEERSASGIVIESPLTCPACGQRAKTEEDSSSHIVTSTCTNAACPGRLVSHFQYIGKREVMDIEGLGDVLAEQFVSMGIAPSMGCLWAWAKDAEDLRSQDEAAFDASCTEAGFGLAAIKSLLSGLVKARTAPWDKWLQALGIPGIAKEMARGIAANLQLQPEDLPRLPDRLMEIVPGSIEGIGKERLQDIQLWALGENTQADLQLLWDSGVRPASTVQLHEGPTPLSGLVIVLTGEFGEDRERLSKKLEKLGAVCKGGVSKRVNLLLVGDGAGHNKSAKAKELGIRMEGKEWLIQALKSGGLSIDTGNIPDDEEMMDEL